MNRRVAEAVCAVAAAVLTVAGAVLTVREVRSSGAAPDLPPLPHDLRRRLYDALRGGADGAR